MQSLQKVDYLKGAALLGDLVSHAGWGLVINTALQRGDDPSWVNEKGCALVFNRKMITTLHAKVAWGLGSSAPLCTLALYQHPIVLHASVRVNSTRMARNKSNWKYSQK